MPLATTGRREEKKPELGQRIKPKRIIDRLSIETKRAFRTYLFIFFLISFKLVELFDDAYVINNVIKIRKIR